MLDATTAIDPELIIARVTDYSALVEALKRRKDEFNLTDKAVDALTLLPDGYTGKILGPAHMRCLGPQSLSAMLDVLCVEIVIVKKPEAVARLERRRAQLENDGKRLKPPRLRARASSAEIRKYVPEAAREMARLGASLGGRTRAANLSPRRRSQIARRAARARWSKAAASPERNTARREAR